MNKQIEERVSKALKTLNAKFFATGERDIEVPISYLDWIEFLNAMRDYLGELENKEDKI